MNEQAINDAYSLFTQNGYKKSIDDFKTLISTNPQALSDAYSLFTQNGYKKSEDDFKVLMGIGATPTELKKKEPTALPSSAGQLPSQEAERAVDQDQPKSSFGEVLYGPMGAYGMAPSEQRGVETWDNFSKAVKSSWKSMISTASKAAAEALDLTQDASLMGVQLPGQDYGAYNRKKIAQLKGEETDLSGNFLRNYAEKQKKEAAEIDFDPDTATGFIGQLLPSAAGTAAALLTAPVSAPLATVVGGASVGLLTASAIGSGLDAYDEYKQEKGAEVDPLGRLGVGLLFGAAEFAMEKLSIDKYLPKSSSKIMMDAFMKSIPEEVLEKEGKDLVNQFVKETGSNSTVLKGIVDSIEKGIKVEGPTELLTSIAQEASKYAFYDKEDRDDIFNSNFLGEAVKSFAGGAIMGAGLGPLSFGSQRIANSKRRKAAGQVMVGRDSETGEAVEVIGREGEDYVVVKASGEQTKIPASRIEGSEVNLSYDAFKNILEGSSAGTAMVSEDPEAPQAGESIAFGTGKTTVQKADPVTKTVEVKLPSGATSTMTFDEYKNIKGKSFTIESLNDGQNDLDFISKNGQLISAEALESDADAKSNISLLSMRYPDIEFSVIDRRPTPTSAPDFRIIGKTKPSAQAQQPTTQEPGGTQPATPEDAPAQPVDQGTTTEVPVEAPAPPKIQDMAGRSVTVKIGKRNVSGIVEVDEGGKATITEGNKIYEIPEGSTFKEFTRPVSISPDGDFVVNGEAFTEARIVVEDGQRKALMVRSDGTTKAITSPNLVEEIDYNITLASSAESGKTAIPKTELSESQGLEEARAIARQAKSRTIQQSIEKAATVLKVSYPGVDMIVGEDDADTKAKMVEVLTQRVGAKKAKELADGMDTGGQAVFVDGKPVAVVINKVSANSTTAAHEVWHVVLRDAFGKNPAKFKQFKDEISRTLNKAGYRDISESLDAFAAGYEGDITYEEYLAEFGGLLSSAGFDAKKLSPKEKSLLNQIKEIINKFSMDLVGKKVFLEDATPENIIQFMSAVSDMISRGEDVSAYIRAKGEGVVESGKDVKVDVAKQQQFNKGVEAVKKNAEEYKAKIGNKSRSNEGVPQLFGDVSRMMSKEYEKVKDAPNDPFVKESYDAMMREVIDQYDFIVSKGIKVVKHTGRGEPYANSTDMLKDLRENNTLKFLPNEVAFGQGDTDVTGNIGLEPSGRKLEDGYELTKSEAFRVVHDYFGHGILGNQFGPIGEENATLQHLDLFSNLAAPAVILQTRGQNSWVNFSGVNDEAAKLRSDARKLTKEGKTEEANALLKKAEEIFKFADPKIGVFDHKFNFKRYETARRLKEQEAVNSRADKRDNELSGALERYSGESRRTRGVDKRDVRGAQRLGGIYVNTIAEYSFDDQINKGILAAFPEFKGVQKVYEVTDGAKYREMMISSLKDNRFASSVTIHSAEDFNQMRMFVTEDGSTGITITKEGFLGGAFSNPNAKRPNNLAQLMVLGIKEGATTAEAFDTVLPDYYSQFGFKAVSRTAFNDEYRPLIENGNTIADWDYDVYKKYNNGRPDVVFFIYDGGDRNTIEDRLGLFDTYSYYDKEFTKSFDKDGYMDAEAVMKQEAVKRLEYEAEMEVEVVEQKPKKRNVLTESKGLTEKEKGKQGLEEILSAKEKAFRAKLKKAKTQAAKAAREGERTAQQARLKDFMDAKKTIVESIQDLMKQKFMVGGKEVSVPPSTVGQVNKILNQVLKGKSLQARYKIDPGGNRVPYMSTVEEAISNVMKIIADSVRKDSIDRARANRRVAKNNVKAGKLGVLPTGGSIDQLLQIDPSIVPLSVFDQYMEIINEIGQRKKVLPLEEQGILSHKVQDILDAVDAENGLLEQLALAYDNHPKVIAKRKDSNTGQIVQYKSYSKTIEDMLSKGVISKSEYDLMRIRKDAIVSKTPSQGKAPMTRQEADAVVNAAFSLKSSLPSPGAGFTSFQNNVIRVFNNLTKADIEAMVREVKDDKGNVIGYNTADVANLARVMDNLSNGYITNLAQTMSEKIQATKKANKVASVISKYKNNPLNWISASKATIKNFFNGKAKGTTTINEKIRRTGNYAIDVALNNFENSDVYNEILRPISVAIERKDKELQAITSEVVQIIDSIPIKDQFEQNTLVRMIMLHKMRRSDPTMPSVKEWIEATKKGDSQYLDETIDKIQSMYDSVEVNGDFDINEAMDKLSPKGEKLLKAIEKIQKDSLSPKVAFGATVIRGSRVPVLEYYAATPRMVNGKKDVVAEEGLIKNYTQPSSRASTFHEKTKVAHEISFDAVESVLWSARHTLTDFYLTPELRTAQATVKNIKRMDWKGQQKEAADALDLILTDSIEMVLGSQFGDRSTTEKITQGLVKKAYQSMLAGFIRPGVELVSNISYALIDGASEFYQGIKVLSGKTKPGIMSDAVFNLGSSQLNRMFNLKGGASRYADASRSFSYDPMRDEITGMRKFAKVASSVGDSFDTFSNTTMSAPDQIVARTVFFGALSIRFKELAGKDINLEKVADNDQAYMEANFENLKLATEFADSRVAEGFSSASDFDGILRNKVTRSDKWYATAFKSFNGFMNKFLVSEYVTSVKAVNAMIGNGNISRVQGAKMLVAQSARMMSYSYLMTLVNGYVYNKISELILDQLGVEPPEEEEEEVYDEEGNLLDTEESYLNVLARETASVVAALAIDRNFGNITKMLTSTGVEALNKAYGDGITYKGPYNQYEDNVSFPFFEVDKKAGGLSTYEQTLLKGSGAMSPYMRNVMDMMNHIDYARMSSNEATVKKHKDAAVLSGIKMLALVTGVPLYRDFNKINQEVTYAIRQAEKNTVNQEE